METIIAVISATLGNVLLVFLNNKYTKKQRGKLMDKLKYSMDINEKIKETFRRYSVMNKNDLQRIESLENVDLNEPFGIDPRPSPSISLNSEELDKYTKSIEELKKYVEKKKKKKEEKELTSLIELQLKDAEDTIRNIKNL